MTEEKEKAQEIIVEINEDSKKANDIYDNLRKKVNSFRKDKFKGKYGEILEYLFLLPDLLALMVRLAGDKRVQSTQKLMIGGIILYVISPIDIIPDFIPVLGLVDDLLLVVYGLNALLNEIDPQIVREHWSGEDDLLLTLKNAIFVAERFLSRNVVKRISTIFNKLTGK
ncbi:MAG: YkvA family protein [Candidatus Stygibacter frigidus]|nr:YkvA family protein [Candidatus Stygibacter frigidus]